MNDWNARANQVFAHAIEIESPGERTAFLDRECKDDQPLRNEVEALLDSHRRAGSFLEQPATGLQADSDEPVELAQSVDGKTGHFENAGQSVLKSLGKHLAAVPHVLLRDANGDTDPIAFPRSQEVPQAGAKYHLLGEIARGGIGAILKGRDTDLGRDLAVKILLDEHKDKPEVIQRFIEEAQIGGQLQHPGIAPVYELGQFADQRPFFSMKLIKGDTLSTLLVGRDQPTDERGKLLSIFEQICQTMAYAHSRGVIHRDLKPSNIMVGAFGEVQVMDWGLAKVLAAGGVVDEKKAFEKHKDVSVIQTLRSVGSDTPGGFGSDTRMGSVLGTPAYMPPEQALGEIDNLDERSDVFGLGAILCEILTGQPPYTGSDGGQIFRLATRGKLDECFGRLDRSAADADLVELAKRCLAPEPCDRPRDAAELADCVSGYLESVEAKLRETELERAAQTARVVEEQKRRRVTMALAASIMLMLSIAGGAWMFFKNQQTNRLHVATTEVNEALGDARLHLGVAEGAEPALKLQELEKALIVAERAESLAHQHNIDDRLQNTVGLLLADLRSNVAVSRQQIERSTAERKFVNALENIRLSQDEDQRDELSNRSSVATRYETAFRDAGLDLEKLNVEEAARIIRQSRSRERIITALDDWSSYRHITRAELKANAEHFWRAVAASQWMEATERGEVMIQEEPEKALNWLRVAPVLVLSGDEAGYRDFCRRMVERFADEPDLDFSKEKTCKACLLWPDSIDIRSLPTDFLENYLNTQDSDTSKSESTPDLLLGWFWGTHALVAYRKGDPSVALDCLAKSRRNEPTPVAEAFNAALETLAKHRLNRPDTHEVMDKATRLVDQLLEKEFDPGSHHDLLLALVLLREAEAQVLNKPLPAFFSTESVTAKQLRVKARAVADAADPNEWRRTVRNALQESDVDKLKHLATSEGMELESPELITWLGVALREAGEQQLAITVMQRGLVEHLDDFWLHWELANTVDEPHGNKRDGIGYLRAAVACRPSSNEALLRLGCRLRNAGLRIRRAGLLSESQGLLSESREVLERLIARDPGVWWYRTDLVSVLLPLEEYDSAIVHATKATELSPNVCFTHGYVAETLSKQGKLEAAIEAYRTAIAVNRSQASTTDVSNAEDSRCARYYTRLGNELSMQGDFDEAIEQYSTALSLLGDQAPGSMTALSTALPINVLLQQQLISTSIADMLARQGRLAASVEAYRKASNAIEDLIPSLANEISATALGNAYESCGYCQERIADAMFAQGRPQEAREALQKVVELVRQMVKIDPTNSHSLRLLAHSIAAMPPNENGDYTNIEEAIAAGRSAVRVDPQDADALSVLGFALYRDGQSEAALAALRSSLELQESDVDPLQLRDTWLVMAMSLWRIDERAEARQWYQKALAYRDKQKNRVPGEPNSERFIQHLFEEAAALIALDEPEEASDTQPASDQTPKAIGAR